MIDLTPGRKSIPERYGVELPRQALARLLAHYMGEHPAQALLAELRAAELRYGRAVRVEGIRRRSQRPGRQNMTPRQIYARERDRAILANAAAYIAGDWAPPPASPPRKEPAS